MTEKLYIYDTTLRDGQQTQGVDFSLDDKRRITEMLDELCVDYIEAGWPGANPTDSDFFANPPKTRAKMTAFGMTKRAGRSAENDEVLSGVLNAETGTVCLVGKTSAFHVTDALGITLEENIENISASMKRIVALGREAIFDAEHFFDGYKLNPEYATLCVKTAYDAGARWVVLCDTNGGTLPNNVENIVKSIIDSGIPGDHLGIHAHNDTEMAVAVSLAAVSAGVRQIQGTINGLGERCGNANLTSLIATLKLKPPYNAQFELGVEDAALAKLTQTSRLLEDIINRVPSANAAYVGASAFVHKSGLHASAIAKNPTTYEHVNPEIIGNQRIIPMSNQAGQSNLIKRLSDAGIDIEKGDARLSQILQEVKAREDNGYAYDSASASFELIARGVLGIMPSFFEVKRYRVTVERRKNKHGDMVSVSEAVVVVKIGAQKHLAVSESRDEKGRDMGPVNALWRAMSKDLGAYQDITDGIELIDFKVRIYGKGTDAVTRVLIDSRDEDGNYWSTVGVSSNIVDASFEALLDAVNWKLVQSGIAPV